MARLSGASTRQTRQGILAAAGVIIVCRLPAFRWPIFDDESIFAPVAALMNAGGRLYGDGGVDNKFPGIFWLYAAVFRLFGRYSMYAVHAVALASVLATAALLGLIAHRLAGRRAALLTAVFYGVFTTVFPRIIAANTEIFMMLPLVASVWLIFPRSQEREKEEESSLLDLFVAGALVASASLFKQVAAVNLLVLWWVARRHWLRAVFVSSAGFAAVFAVVALGLAHEGSLANAWHWTIVRLLSHYGPSAWHGRVLTDGLISNVLPFSAAALLLVIASAAAFARHPRSQGEQLVWIWAAASLLGVIAGGHFFAHYFVQLVGPLAILSGVEIDRRLEVATPLGRRRISWAVVLLTALPAVGFLVVSTLLEPVTEQFGAPKPNYLAVARYAEEHTSPDERIFVWGGYASLYIRADRLPASRFVAFLRGLSRDQQEPVERAWDAGPDVWPLLEADFAAHPPALILDTAPANYSDFAAYPMSRFPVLDALVKRDYTVERTIDQVVIYRRRPPAHARSAFDIDR